MFIKSLFPASAAKDRTRLQVLDITKCKELAVISRKDEEGEGETSSSERAPIPPSIL